MESTYSTWAVVAWTAIAVVSLINCAEAQVQISSASGIMTYHQQPAGCIPSTCDYLLTGSVDHTRREMNFVLSTALPTTPIRWLGLGVSNDALMPNSDITIGYWDGQQAVVTDRFATIQDLPPIDSDQSQITRHSGSQINGVTTIQFSRACDTSNTEDIPFEGNHYFLFAYGIFEEGSPQYHTFRMPSAMTYNISCAAPPTAGTTATTASAATTTVSSPASTVTVPTTPLTTMPSTSATTIPTAPPTAGTTATTASAATTTVPSPELSVTVPTTLPTTTVSSPASTVTVPTTPPTTMPSTSATTIPSEPSGSSPPTQGTPKPPSSVSGMTTTMSTTSATSVACPPLVVTKIVLNLNKRFLAVTIDEMASGLNLSATPIACSGFTIVVGGGAPRVTPTSTGVVQNGTLWELRCSLTGSEAADLLGVSTITSSVIITVPTLRPCPTSHNITTIRNDMTGPQLSRATANLATGRIVLIFDEPLANNVADFSADFDVGSTTISLRNLSASVLPSNHSRFIFLISSNDLSRVAGAHRVMIRISRMKIADKAGNKNMLIFQEGTFIAQGTAPTSTTPAPCLFVDLTNRSLNLDKRFFEASVDQRNSGVNLSADCGVFTIFGAGKAYNISLIGNGTVQSTEPWILRCSITGSDAASFAGISNLGTTVTITLPTLNLCQTSYPILTILNDTTGPVLSGAIANYASGHIVLTFDEPVENDAVDFMATFASQSSPPFPTNLVAKVSPANRSIFIYQANCSGLSLVAGSTRVAITISAMELTDIAGNQNKVIGLNATVVDQGPILVGSTVLNLNSRHFTVTINDLAANISLMSTPISCSAFKIIVGGLAPNVTLTGDGIIQNRTYWTVQCGLTGSEAASLVTASGSSSSLVISRSIGVHNSDGQSLYTSKPCLASGNRITTIVGDTTGPLLSSATANFASGRIVLTFDEPLENNATNFMATFLSQSVPSPPPPSDLVAEVSPSNRSVFIFQANCSGLLLVAGSTRVTITISAMELTDVSGNNNSKTLQQDATVVDPGPILVTIAELNLNSRHFTVTINDLAANINLTSTPISCSAFKIIVGGLAPNVTLTGDGIIQNKTDWTVQCGLTGSEAASLVTASGSSSSLVISRSIGVHNSNGQSLYTSKPCLASGNHILRVRSDTTGPVLERATADLRSGRIIMTFDEPLVDDATNFTATYSSPSSPPYPTNLVAEVSPTNRSVFTFQANCSGLLSLVAGSTRVAITISAMELTDVAGNQNKVIGLNATVVDQGVPGISSWILDLSNLRVEVGLVLKASDLLNDSVRVDCSALILLGSDSSFNNVSVTLSGYGTIMNRMFYCPLIDSDVSALHTLDAVYLRIANTSRVITTQTMLTVETVDTCYDYFKDSRIIRDTAPPTVLMMSMNLETQNGRIWFNESIHTSTVTFSINFNVSCVNITATKTANSSVFTFQISCEDQLSFLASSGISAQAIFIENSFYDLVGNGNEELGVSVLITNLGVPGIANWTLDLNNLYVEVVLALKASEFLSDSMLVNCSALTLLDSSDTNRTITLQGNGTVENSTMPIAFRCPLTAQHGHSLGNFSAVYLRIANESRLATTKLNRTVYTAYTCVDYFNVTRIIPDTLPFITAMSMNLLTGSGTIVFSEGILNHSVKFSIDSVSSPVLGTATRTDIISVFTFRVDCTDRDSFYGFTPVGMIPSGSVYDLSGNSNHALMVPVNITTLAPISISHWLLNLDKGVAEIALSLQSNETLLGSKTISCTKLVVVSPLGNFSLGDNMDAGANVRDANFTCKVNLKSYRQQPRNVDDSTYLVVEGPTGVMTNLTGRRLIPDECRPQFPVSNVVQPLYPDIQSISVNLTSRYLETIVSETLREASFNFILNSTGSIVNVSAIRDPQQPLTYSANLSCEQRNVIARPAAAILKLGTVSDENGWKNKRQSARLNITQGAPINITEWSLDLEMHTLTFSLSRSPGAGSSFTCSDLYLLDTDNSTATLPTPETVKNQTQLSGMPTVFAGSTRASCSTGLYSLWGKDRKNVVLYTRYTPALSVPFIITDNCSKPLYPKTVTLAVKPNISSAQIDADTLQVKFTFSEPLNSAQGGFPARLMSRNSSLSSVIISPDSQQGTLDCSSKLDIDTRERVTANISADAFYDIYDNSNSEVFLLDVNWTSNENWVLDLDSGEIHLSQNNYSINCSAIKVVVNSTKTLNVSPSLMSTDASIASDGLRCTFNRDEVNTLSADEQSNLILQIKARCECFVRNKYGIVVNDTTPPLMVSAVVELPSLSLTVTMSESIRQESGVQLEIYYATGSIILLNVTSYITSRRLAFSLPCEVVSRLAIGITTVNLKDNSTRDLAGNYATISSIRLTEADVPLFTVQNSTLDLEASTYTVRFQYPQCLNIRDGTCRRMVFQSWNQGTVTNITVQNSAKMFSNSNQIRCRLAGDSLYDLQQSAGEGSVLQLLPQAGAFNVFGSRKNFGPISIHVINDTTAPMLTRGSVTLSQNPSITLEFSEPVRQISQSSLRFLGQFLPIIVSVNFQNRNSSLYLPILPLAAESLAMLYCDPAASRLLLDAASSQIVDATGNKAGLGPALSVSVSIKEFARPIFNISRPAINTSIVDFTWKSLVTASKLEVFPVNMNRHVFHNTSEASGKIYVGNIVGPATISAMAEFGQCGSVLVNTMSIPPDPGSSGGSSGAAAGAAGAVSAVLVVVILILIVVAYKRKSRKKSVIGDSEFWSKGDDVSQRMAATNKMFYSDDAAAAFSQSRYKNGITLVEFADHVQHMHSDCDYPFTEEYEIIRRWCQENPYDAVNSTLAVNAEKNRYRNIMAYDHSRVQLSAQEDCPGSDYINANYIQGYSRLDAFIAAQGPLTTTLDDFWRMIWEENSLLIVMLTNLVEQGKIKCEKYWPDQGVVVYGSIAVEMLEEEKFATYVMRTFSITRVSEASPDVVLSGSRTVTQLHFIVWPDHGVPERAGPLLAFEKRIRDYIDPEAGPVLVHCSAGVGRTGTLITIHNEMKRIEADGTVNVFGTVMAMRERRNLMVQTEHQYIFIHDVLTEYISLGDSSIPVDGLKKAVWRLSETEGDKTGYAIEMSRLPSARPYPQKTVAALRPVNRNKNRTNVYVPLDTNRVRLPVLSGEVGSDYINASLIDGHKRQQALIVTQHPLQSTVYDFWRMVWGTRAACVVMLNALDETETDMGAYWPEEGETSDFEALTVQVVNKYESQNFVQRDIDVRLKPQAQLPAMKSTRVSISMHKPDNEPLRIRHFQFSGWGTDMNHQPTVEATLDLLKNIYAWKLQCIDSRPVIVHCDHGADRSGTFCALYNMRERLMSEQEVDVFQTVRLLRFARYNMCSTECHYQLLYKSMVEYSDSLPETSII